MRLKKGKTPFGYKISQKSSNQLEEIPEEPDVYETHKANLYAHGVKLPAMMEVRYCGGKWVERVVFALDDDGYALCNDRNLIRCRPIQTQNVEELKNSAYLGLK